MKIVIWTLKQFVLVFAATVATVLIASPVSTNRVINDLNKIGSNSSLTDRVSMSLYDLIHFGTLYGIFIFLALAIAFTASSGVFKIARFGRTLIYIAAGAIAMFVMLWAMEQVFFGVPIVAGARDAAGLVQQMLAGAIGGLIFARLSSPKPAKST